MSVSAVFPGSFNPVHPGHLDIIRKASGIFGRVYVLIAKNPAKTYDVDPVTRKKWIQRVLAFNGLDNVLTEINMFDTLAEFTLKYKVNHVVRGIKGQASLDYEESQVPYNRILNPAMEYVYLTADRIHDHFSSTSVKQFVKLTTPVMVKELYGPAFPEETVEEIYNAYKSLK